VIVFIAHVRVKAENAAAYEALMADVAAQTRAHEPGVLSYTWARSVADLELYVVIEAYRDVPAHQAHMASRWVTAALPKAAELMSGRPEIRQYVSAGSEPVRAPGVFYRDLD
jgi:quinol monooxygenase YgiN